ncbi:TauD/TfdA family dioxygenase [Acrocarpospora macrocephala]|uniref:TauD/TfdA-like domain-containing protein n=1 Tax=Acrocarpospora macrocephala TaxID=150177 RepID=A0A5M3X5I1_9ACTN|nr:TauD/TfdA family dioxygenase [Acrocarpospora macrocephala]GES16340.1 hypothetical protein Amac_099380 [Acrocarpospora macrocephala]
MNGYQRAGAELAEQGWTVLHRQRFGADHTSVLAIAEHFGRPSTRDGGQAVWEVKPRPGRAHGTFSERTGPAAFHTDAQYHARPEDYVCLFVVRPAADGGDTRLLGAAAALSTVRPGTLAALRRPAWSWTVPEVFRATVPASRPATVATADGTIRWRADNLAQPLPGDQRRAATDFAVALERAEACEVRHRPGDVIILDNRRTLHARTAFQDTDRLVLRVRLWRS